MPPGDGRNLPVAYDPIQPSRGFGEQHLAVANRQLVKNVGGYVVPYVEVRGASKFVDVEDILDGRALLSCPRFGGRAVIDGVRPGVVEVEIDSVAHLPAQ